ncbi:chemotaxis protein CheD [Burkholderiaceae bacterium DAT-1]|nr:chemotaxis protein CheD [Burkholderiaceae bacterium DAT-1]
MTSSPPNQATPAIQAIEHFVHPGQICFDKAPGHILTLLGTCISITVWHPERKLGGLCHYLLPEPDPRKPTASDDGRYATLAVSQLVMHMTRFQTQPAEYVTRMFGGTETTSSRHAALEIGLRNIAAGLDLLAAYGLKLADADVGGRRYRRLDFDLGTGQVNVSYGPFQGAMKSGGRS